MWRNFVRICPDWDNKWNGFSAFPFSWTVDPVPAAAVAAATVWTSFNPDPWTCWPLRPRRWPRPRRLQRPRSRRRPVDSLWALTPQAPTRDSTRIPKGRKRPNPRGRGHTQPGSPKNRQTPPLSRPNRQSQVSEFGNFWGTPPPQIFKRILKNKNNFK